jgi:biopolymer transport protein ExbD
MSAHLGRRRRRRVDEGQRVLPLINVVFLLLIFFMVAGKLAHSDAVHITPPVSDSENWMDDNNLQVLFAADGRIFLDGEAVPRAELTERLRSLSGNRADKTVRFKADGAAEATEVIDILERIRSARIDKVKLQTKARPRP